jgi:hypothetical protein
MKRICLIAVLWTLGSPAAIADCAAPVAVAAPLDGPLQPLSRAKNYQPALQSCNHNGGAEKLAIRTMTVDGQDLFLAVDPRTLATRLERRDCWTCDPTTDEAQAHTRFIAAVNRFAQEKGPQKSGWLDNAGLTHGRGDGVFVTGDLCPSQKPLDRDFLQKLEKPGEATPVALSVSGLWIARHADDFAWLRRQKAEGRLAISFVNHSFSHPYRPGLATGQNFLLAPGVDMQREVFDVERLLIANGETPSVFFRFPGLISDPSLMEAVRKYHLIPLGANAWLALNQKASAGAVVLVHPNGNEPLGLKQFETQRGKLPQPLRPIEDAP